MSSGRKLILYVLYFIVVVIFAVGIIMAFTRHDTKKPVVTVPSHSQKTSGSQNAEGTVTSGTRQSPAEPTKTSTDANAAASTRSALGGTATPSQLANTGPGSTIVVFAATSVAGAWAYRRRQLSRVS